MLGFRRLGLRAATAFLKVWGEETWLRRPCFIFKVRDTVASLIWTRVVEIWGIVGVHLQNATRSALQCKHTLKDYVQIFSYALTISAIAA